MIISRAKASNGPEQVNETESWKVYPVLKIKKRFIVNEKNEPVEVVLDLKTFEMIEEILEDHLFGEILDDVDKAAPLPLKEAKQRYARIKKRS